jgi:hypothetical protein
METETFDPYLPVTNGAEALQYTNWIMENAENRWKEFAAGINPPICECVQLRVLERQTVDELTAFLKIAKCAWLNEDVLATKLRADPFHLPIEVQVSGTAWVTWSSIISHAEDVLTRAKKEFIN